MTTSVATVLVVDDPDAAAETASRLERGLDFAHAVTAASIPEAMATVENDSVECIVSGYEIPDADGHLLQGGERFLRALRAYDDSLPFILFTEVGNDAIARKVIAAGVTDYIRRYDTESAYEQLLDRVRAAIDTRQTERRAEHLHRLNETMRLVHQGVIRASEPGAIDRAVVDRIVRHDLYRHAAVGDVDDGQFRVRATATAEGVSAEYPWRDLDVQDSIETIQSRSIEAHRLVFVPIVHGEVHRGVLALTTERSGAFGETERVVLRDLGETVAHAYETVETRRRLEARERELREQNDRLDRFASVLSHDLRNPLQVASGHLDLLGENVESDRVEKIDDALGRMSALIDDVLTLARGEEQGLVLEPIVLDDLARCAWEEVATERSSIEIDPAVGTVHADRSQLRRLFANLFRNAIEHSATDSDEHVTVWLDWIDDGERIGFAVEDDGIGIPVDDREVLFEFGRTTDASHTGLGLAIVTEIVDAHGWAITATESDSGGARFEIIGVESA